VDFYHAVEHLSLLVSHIKKPKPRREAMVSLKRLLTAGKVSQLLSEAEIQICKGRNAKKIRKLLNYFRDHVARMRYAHFRKQNIPTGSGAVESCVRRVINLRMKGNGIYWLAQNAEGLMHMRAQLLTGHWKRFIHNVLEPECSWNPQGYCDRPVHHRPFSAQFGLAA
jgi:hypothetical protein